MKPRRDPHTEMIVRNMKRAHRKRVAQLCVAAREQECRWTPDDGKPILGINEDSDHAEFPYVVMRNVVAKHPSLKDMFIAAGEKTDLGSIPWLLKVLPVFRPTAPGKRAFLRHDIGYRYQVHDRLLLDTVMRIELVADGMPRWAATVCYYAVRLFGRKAWARHAARIARGKAINGEPD